MPQQWRTSQIALLVKNQDIERPIALCHVVYKCWLKTRYHLVNQWLKEFKILAPWDAARPGIAAMDICVKRVFMAEIARARQKARISLFLDLSTFYETVSHSLLHSNAIEVGFPLVVLNGAVQIYRGARILQGDSQSSPPASFNTLHKVLKTLPKKAPGPDGWTNGLLRKLPPPAIEDLLSLFRVVEATGLMPQQWRTSQIALLVKNQDIERPIALCHVVYKCWLKTRYHLVNQWLKEFKILAPWDAARPGIAAIDICVKRVFMAEIARARQKARISLFLDLSTFYETVSHSLLHSNAIEVGFPLAVLNGAVQIYRGARILQGDSQSSPPAYAQKGILAGCPVAPALSKVALFPVCKRVHQDGLATVLDVWIDDISADVEHFDPQIAARRAYKLYSLLKGLLPASELLLNFKKSAFTCSDPKAAAALKKLLGADDPKVCGVVKDLGVDNSGARRRRIKQSKARLDKAAARNSKLQKLAVPTRKIAVRVNRVGVQTTATWGHQAQGLAPKRIKVIRAAAGGHAFRQALGSLDLVFDLGEFFLQDPAERVLLEHWITFAVFIPSLSKEVFLKSWEVSWTRLRSSPHPWNSHMRPKTSCVGNMLVKGLSLIVNWMSLSTWMGLPMSKMWLTS